MTNDEEGAVKRDDQKRRLWEDGQGRQSRETITM